MNIDWDGQCSTMSLTLIIDPAEMSFTSEPNPSVEWKLVLPVIYPETSFLDFLDG